MVAMTKIALVLSVFLFSMSSHATFMYLGGTHDPGFYSDDECKVAMIYNHTSSGRSHRSLGGEWNERQVPLDLRKKIALHDALTKKGYTIVNSREESIDGLAFIFNLDVQISSSRTGDSTSCHFNVSLYGDKDPEVNGVELYYASPEFSGNIFQCQKSVSELNIPNCYH